MYVYMKMNIFFPSVKIDMSQIFSLVVNSFVPLKHKYKTLRYIIKDLYMVTIYKS